MRLKLSFRILLTLPRPLPRGTMSLLTVSRGYLSSRLLSPVTFIPLRGKKKVAKKQKKNKKDLQREAMKEYLKALELRKQAEEAIMKVAKRGEPLDPEMLNPARKRDPYQLSDEEKNQELLLVKEWTKCKMEQHKQELQQLQAMIKSRTRALEELRKVSLPLYQQALDLRTDLFPFNRTGPTTTPPLPEYMPPEEV